MKKIFLIFPFIFLIGCQSQQLEFWNYPIKINDSKKQVDTILGESSNGATDDKKVRWYPKSGVSINFNNKEKVTGINYKGNYGYDDWVTYKGKIINGIDLKMTGEELLTILGEPKEIDKEFGLGDYWTYIWEKENLSISVDIWIKDYEEEGKQYKKDTIKWLSIDSLDVDSFSIDLTNLDYKLPSYTKICIPEKKQSCSIKECKEVEPTVFIAYDEVQNLVYRCDSKPCDRYEVSSKQSGIYKNIEPIEPRGFSIKISNENDYIESVNIGLDTLISYGKCK